MKGWWNRDEQDDDYRQHQQNDSRHRTAGQQLTELGNTRERNEGRERPDRQIADEEIDVQEVRNHRNGDVERRKEIGGVIADIICNVVVCNRWHGKNFTDNDEFIDVEKGWLAVQDQHVDQAHANADADCWQRCDCDAVSSSSAADDKTDEERQRIADRDSGYLGRDDTVDIRTGEIDRHVG